MDALVSTQWLSGEARARDLRIIDATYFLNAPGDPARDGTAEYDAAHLPGAVFLDLASLKDAASPYPMMLPTADAFADRMTALGIAHDDRIILYDNSPLRSSTRAWWMLRLFGASSVAILDGGFAKWQAEGRPLESGQPNPEPALFQADEDRRGVRSLDQVRANLTTRTEQLLDARPAARFTGDEPDPRPGAASGHIPGARNLPHSRLFHPDGSWKTANALITEFSKAGIDLDQPVVTTCGSGMTASVLAFALHLLGRDAALYDGSWAEWGMRPDTEKATGSA